jgi:hypothetical protein
MQKHIGKVCSTASYHLRKIARIRKHISRAATAQLVSALVLSKIDYGNSLLAGLPDNGIYPLQKVQNAAARVVTGGRRRDPTSRHLKDLHWLPISYRIDFKIAVLTWRCLNGCAPSYLSSLLHRRNLGGRTLRSSSTSSSTSASLSDLALPSIHVKSYGRRAFSNYDPTLWNSLPGSIRSSPSLKRFGSALKTHLFRAAFNI